MQVFNVDWRGASIAGAAYGAGVKQDTPAMKINCSEEFASARSCGGRLEALLTLWRGKLHERPMPARNDFTVRELGPWLGHLALIEVSNAGEFKFRLCGTELRPCFQCDATGVYVHHLPQTLRDPLSRQLNRVCGTGIPMFAVQEESIDGERVTFSELLLPLSHDGIGVTMLMLAIYHSAP